MNAPDQRKTFVLVHGAWQGGWAFAGVAELLRAQGHRVFTPTLTGLGERSHLAGRFPIDWRTHVEDIANVIRWEELGDVILCGHSYGGIVISGVAEALPDRIAALVYLDAMLPEPGKSVFAMNKSAPLIDGLLRAASETGGQSVPPIPSAAFGTIATQRQRVDRLATPHPLASFCVSVELSGGYLAVPRKTYVRATGWSGYEELGFHAYRTIADDDSWTKIDLAYGHELMFNAPEELAQLLLDTARPAPLAA